MKWLGVHLEASPFGQIPTCLYRIWQPKGGLVHPQRVLLQASSAKQRAAAFKPANHPHTHTTKKPAPFKPANHTAPEKKKKLRRYPQQHHTLPESSRNPPRTTPEPSRSFCKTLNPCRTLPQSCPRAYLGGKQPKPHLNQLRVSFCHLLWTTFLH